jgi:ribosome biogenesis GTPase A
MAQPTAYKLAALHSIGRGAYDDEEVALTLGLYLLRHYRELLAQRYGMLPRPCDEHMLLALIAAARSLAKKAGGGPDLARASVALLNDFRTGALGRITLETVDEVDRPPLTSRT